MSDEGAALARLIAQANHKLESRLSATLKAKGLSLQHFRILSALVEQDGRTMSDLAAWALADPPAMTKMVDRVVAAGSVYRTPDPKDRRKVLVFISDHGRTLQTKAFDPARDCASEVFDPFAVEDRATLSRILLSLVN